MSEDIAPTTLEVRVVTDRGARSWRRGITDPRSRGRGIAVARSLRRGITAALLVAVVAGVFLAGALALGPGGAGRRTAAGTGASGAQGVDAAYGLAQRCLIVSTLKGYVRVDSNRYSPCGRYGGTARPQ